MITSETVTVWKTSFGRRYLTKRAAFRNDTLHRLKAKDRHEMRGVHDELIGGNHHQEEFYTPEQWALFEKIAARYYRWFGRRSA